MTRYAALLARDCGSRTLDCARLGADGVRRPRLSGDRPLCANRQRRARYRGRRRDQPHGVARPAREPGDTSGPDVVGRIRLQVPSGTGDRATSDVELRPVLRRTGARAGARRGVNRPDACSTGSSRRSTAGICGTARSRRRPTSSSTSSSRSTSTGFASPSTQASRRCTAASAWAAARRFRPPSRSSSSG